MVKVDSRINDIVEFIKNKKTILLVGSGPSIDANVAGWDSLESILRYELAQKNISTDELNIYQLMDRAKLKIPGKYYEILRNVFRNQLVEPSELDELLSSLRSYFKFVVTPNYDKLLETAFRTIRTGIDPPITIDLNVAKSLHRKGDFFIYKFNGDIDNEDSIVLGVEDYANKDYDEVFNFLANFKTLYVGYGFRDSILEYFRKKVEKSKPSWKNDVLIMIKKGNHADQLTDEKYQVITFSDFEEQKNILREVCTSLLADNPFRRVYQKICIPANDILTHPLFSKIKDYVLAVSGRILILHENWEIGWNANDFKYEIKGEHLLPEEAKKIVDKFKDQIDRPWWGKLAFMKIVYPLTERPGKIIGTITSYRKYSLLWKKMDDVDILKGTTVREKWWQHDIRKKFEDSELPHILCMHMAVISKDSKLLLTRKSENVDFERKAWCPSIEEQTSYGDGEETKGNRPIDDSPMATCLRGLREELRIPKEWVDSIKFHAFCTDWLYSEVNVIATVLLNVDSSKVSAEFGGEDVGEFQLDPKRWIQYSWTPARVDNISKLVKSLEYGDEARLRGTWHVTAKLRLFSVMASMVQWKRATWDNWDQKFQ